jgi:hypothetical protein
MSERDFEIGGRKFKLNKINAIKQFHIVRRIVPILSDLGPVMGDVQKVMNPNSNISEAKKFERAAKIMTPILNGISNMSEADSNKVLFGLLSAVEMKQEHGNWAFVANDEMLLFQDMELPILLQLAGRSFMFNLSGFFSVLPQAL